MKNKKEFLVIIVAVIIMFGTIGAMGYVISLDKAGDDYCEDNGYHHALSIRERIGDHYRIQCYKEIIRNNESIGIDEWIRWGKE